MTIISAIVVGAIVGALARFALPGKQEISLLMTVIIGAVGAGLGSWLLGMLGYQNESGIAWIGLIGGVVVAAALIVLYGSLTGRKQLK